MPDKYTRLTDDLRAASSAALLSADHDDGGTCNFDSLMLSLPRWNHQKIEDAIENAGLTGYHLTGSSWCISPPIPAQGFRRTAQAEAMRDKMKELGYTAAVYYQID